MDSAQTKAIKKLIPEGATFFAATRCVLSEWPKMVERTNGQGKSRTSKVCQNQAESDAYVAAGQKGTKALADVTED